MKQLLLILALLSSSRVWAQETLYSGEFEADGYFTTFEGSWKIVKAETGTVLIFEDDFKAKKAPDLKIFLSTRSLEDIDDDNASDAGTSVLISLLKKYKGAMEFKIPDDINPADYKSLIVHCVKYAELWGGSDLN